LVDAHTDNSGLEIEYYGYKETGDVKDEGSYKNCWLDKDKKWFEVSLKKVCPVDSKYRSNFVIHCTAGEMTEKSIKAKQNTIILKRKEEVLHIYM